MALNAILTAAEQARLVEIANKSDGLAGADEVARGMLRWWLIQWQQSYDDDEPRSLIAEQSGTLGTRKKSEIADLLSQVKGDAPS